ncbi:hypothetical protein [Streptomyces sp. NBC_01506]|uniref:hypothetical protein n=1 Tax=Streptomyces sp. NBC_01506 TaxID=2903887 RepID=UPI00386CB9F4
MSVIVSYRPLAYLRRRRRPDGVAVFARRSLFGRLGHGDDAALIAQLTFEERPFYVARTHLAWQPRSTPPAEYVGHHQMLALLAHRDAVAPPWRRGSRKAAAANGRGTPAPSTAAHARSITCCSPQAGSDRATASCPGSPATPNCRR